MRILFIDGAWAKDNACVLFEQEKPILTRLVDYIGLDLLIRTGCLDLAVIEGVYARRNIDTTLKLAYNIGVVLGMCIRYQISLKLLHPTTWKHGVGLWGVKNNAIKEQIYASYTSITDTDLRDAVVMGFYYLSHPGAKTQVLYAPDDISKEGKLYA